MKTNLSQRYSTNLEGEQAGKNNSMQMSQGLDETTAAAN